MLFRLLLYIGFNIYLDTGDSYTYRFNIFSSPWQGALPLTIHLITVIFVPCDTRPTIGLEVLERQAKQKRCTHSFAH